MLRICLCIVAVLSGCTAAHNVDTAENGQDAGPLTPRSPERMETLFRYCDNWQAVIDAGPSIFKLCDTICRALQDC